MTPHLSYFLPNKFGKSKGWLEYLQNLVLVLRFYHLKETNMYMMYVGIFGWTDHWIYSLVR